MQPYDSYEAFDNAIDAVMAKADELTGKDNIKYFVPPRIYIDLGQNDDDNNLPQGWGFYLKTVGALIYRGVIRGDAIASTQPIPKIPSHPDSESTSQPPSSHNPKAAVEDEGSQKQPFNTAALNW